jgi:hypothetical protein
MQTNTVININSDVSTVPVEHQGRFQWACRWKILIDSLQQKSITAMLESDDLSLDEAARKKKLIVALDYEKRLKSTAEISKSWAASIRPWKRYKGRLS